MFWFILIGPIRRDGDSRKDQVGKIFYSTFMLLYQGTFHHSIIVPSGNDDDDVI